MSKLLINITHGPESPTRAALGFLVGRSAAEQGHDVSLFLAGDAVQLLREATLDTLVGLGTGSLRESYDAIVENGGTFYVSGCPARHAASSRTARPRRRCPPASSSSCSRQIACSPTEEGRMGKVINCECGEVVRADSDDELVAKVGRHVQEAHPELVGKLSREDVLGMAEEA
jgi:predicted peroxiredoxin